MAIIDIALVKSVNEYFDIAFADNGDFVLTEGLDTALAMSVLEQRRADASEVVRPELRRGWWGNTLNDLAFEIGSKLWLLSQARKTQSTLTSAEDYAQNALEWMVGDGIIDDVNVIAYFENNTMFIKIDILKQNNLIHTAFFDAFAATGEINQ